VSALAALAAAASTLLVGVLSDPVTLDPHRATDIVAAEITANVCEPLVRYRAGRDRPEAALALTWATADERTWTFTLRPGVRFQDGEPFDASAVVANLDDLRRERRFDGRAERVGALVVAITLDRPNAALLATLSQPFLGMQSPRQLRERGVLPVGTGPFRLVRAGGQLRLEPNADYWGGVPAVTVAYRRYQSEDALEAALEKGEVDVTAALSHERVVALRRVPGVVVQAQTGLNVAFLSLNNERPPFDDARVRTALARAIDRDALVHEILGGEGEAARNPLPPVLSGYSERTRELTLDRRVARRLLQAAGLSHGFEATLLTVGESRPYLPQPRAVAERIRDDLAAVGVRARLEHVPRWTDYVRRIAAGNYDMALLGWEADTMDPNDFLVALLAEESIGSTNRSRYRSERMEALLKSARRTSDPGLRAAAYSEAQDLFQRDMPWIPLYHVALFTAARQPVAGLAVDPTGILRYQKAWKKS
jgi:peptide/nickel transport system substrate-binding protein